jgi:molybdenum cofactor synthesis domain-containing protein
MAKTAGIIIIGNEILSGKFQDTNSQFFVRELRLLGVEVRRISVIPDEVDEISAEVAKFSESYDYVFTSGGIGPTHDDITIEAIAKAFGVRRVINEHLRAILDQRFWGSLTPERLKMAEIPEGADLIDDNASLLPLIFIKNVYIFPGVPELLRKKFLSIAPRFAETPLSLTKVYINEYESEVAYNLNEIVRKFKDVKIGSYPFLETKDYRVIVTFESLDRALLNEAVNSFISAVPKEKLYKVEKD